MQAEVIKPPKLMYQEGDRDTVIVVQVFQSFGLCERFVCLNVSTKTQFAVIEIHRQDIIPKSYQTQQQYIFWMALRHIFIQNTFPSAGCKDTHDNKKKKI